MSKKKKHHDEDAETEAVEKQPQEKKDLKKTDKGLRKFDKFN